MGTLKTDTITGLGNVQEVTFVSNKMTGTASGSITLPGEGGTVTTNLQQGLAKHWIHFDGTAGTPAAADSFNHASITDNGTGSYSSNVTNNMANANFAGFGFCNNQNWGNGNQTTSLLLFESKNDDGDGMEDTNRISMAMIGDLA